MSRTGKLLFALGAHSIFVVGPAAVIGMFFAFPPGPVASPEQGATVEKAWMVLGIAVVISAACFLITLAAGLGHCLHDMSLTGGQQALWVLGLLLIGIVLLPAYFWARVLPGKGPAGDAP